MSPAHRPGCGDSEQRPERAARGAPQFVGAAPSPRRCAGGVSKGRTLRRGLEGYQAEPRAVRLGSWTE